MNIYRKSLYLIFALALTWAVSSGTAYAQDPQVNAANPSSAEQGTVGLEVEISGSGFDNSAAVDFFVTGTTNPGGITVKKIKVRGSKKIIATIDVTEGATVDNFDIEVRLSRGRKGKGTELFKVEEKEVPTPGEPPPEPPPGEGAACASSFDFPAFAFVRQDIKDEGKKFETTRYTVYLANANGNCTIPLYSSLEEQIWNISYVQSGTTGRIIWHQNGDENAGRKECQSCPVIKGLSFEIVDQAIVTDLPLSSSIIYKHDNGANVGIMSVVLNADQSRVYFSLDETDGQGGWDDTINDIDLNACNELCPRNVIATYKNSGMIGLSLNSSEDRLYFSRQDTNFTPELSAASFIENQGGVWTYVRDIVTNRDPGFEDFKPIATASTDWDYDGDGVQTEVIAYGIEDFGTYDIFDASTCLAGLAENSCLGNSEATAIRIGESGWDPKFSNHPSTPTDTPPNLVVWQSPYEQIEIDTDSGTAITTLVDAYDFDSAD